MSSQKEKENVMSLFNRFVRRFGKKRRCAFSGNLPKFKSRKFWISIETRLFRKMETPLVRTQDIVVNNALLVSCD